MNGADEYAERRICRLGICHVAPHTTQIVLRQISVGISGKAFNAVKFFFPKFEMRLAGQADPVAQGSEMVRNIQHTGTFFLLSIRDYSVVHGEESRIELCPEWGTLRDTGVEAVHENGLSGQLINVWRACMGRTCAAEGIPAHIISQHNDKVRAVIRIPGRGRDYCEQDQTKQGERVFHDIIDQRSFDRQSFHLVELFSVFRVAVSVSLCHPQLAPHRLPNSCSRLAALSPFYP